MKSQLHLLIIDPQNDFCDLPENYLISNPQDGQLVQPALPVPGAHADMSRVSELIQLAGKGLTAISITLDSHHRYDIAHPTFWFDAAGKPVTPFTQISSADVRAGKYLPRDPSAMPRALAYKEALEVAGRYQLMIWPVHCEIGSWGQNVHSDIRAAYNSWEDSTNSVVSKLNKGSNPWTEHYSAVMAEVPDATDPDTQLNREFIDSLASADRVYITGEASSHCVRATTEHIVENIKPEDISKLVLLIDCMSPVTGFTEQYEAFIQDMAARGVQIAKSSDVLPELVANQSR